MSISEHLMRLEEEVHDEESFLRFVAALAADWEDEREKEKQHPSSPYGPGANGWENGTIGAFLERASAWAAATERGTQLYSPPQNVWRRCAQILHAGKFYE
jgi:hypothetical protein